LGCRVVHPEAGEDSVAPVLSRLAGVLEHVERQDGDDEAFDGARKDPGHEHGRVEEGVPDAGVVELRVPEEHALVDVLVEDAEEHDWEAGVREVEELRGGVELVRTSKLGKRN
jgi:hypothetical protein